MTDNLALVRALIKAIESMKLPPGSPAAGSLTSAISNLRTAAINLERG